MRRWFAVVTWMNLWSCSAPQTGLPPVMLCDLFRNLPAYTGKMVSVRGIYWSGLRQQCDEPLLIGHEWPTALELVDSGFVANHGQPVRFQTDREAWDRLDRLTIHEARAGRREEIWATTTGELQGPAHVGKDGVVIGGYGHLGTFAAQLVVRTVSQVVIQPTPTYDYGEVVRGPHR